MALDWIQKQKEKYGIGISGSRAKRKRLDKARKVNTSRPRKNRRGRTTGKQYWNPITGKWQNSPVKAPVTKDHLGRDPEVGAKARKKVRENPVSKETLAEVKKQTDKLKIKPAYKKGERGKGESTKDFHKRLRDDLKKDHPIKSNDSQKVDEKGKGVPKKEEYKKSTVFTRHYKTGKALGVMTKRERDKYDKEAHAAGGLSYEERVAKHEKESGHGKKHLRETLYNRSVRKSDAAAKKAARQAELEKARKQREEEERKKRQRTGGE